MTGMESKILKLSVATGCTVATGTRGESKGWFAAVDGIEVEAGSISQAIDALTREVVKVRMAEVREIAARQAKAQAIIATLNRGGQQ